MKERLKQIGRKVFKSRKRTIMIVSGAVVLIGAGIAFVVFGRGARVMAQTTKSATAETGNISTTVVGTGSLAAGNAQNMQVPIGIEIEEVKVESGDTVKSGDILATVDSASVEKELVSVQEEIASVDATINDTQGDTQSTTISSTVSGRVKKIYCSKSDSVTDIMTEKGALMLLSLDGKMAVRLEGEMSVSAGAAVKVKRSNGKTISGTVESVGDNYCIVTVTDNGPGLNEKVTVTKKDGTKLGSGKLYIHQQLAVVGTSGKVKSISVSKNQKVSSGTTLITLKSVSQSAEYLEAVSNRQKLTEKMTSLLKIAEKNAIVAEFDGTIQSVNVSAGSETSKSSSSGSSSSSTGSSSSGNSTGSSTPSGSGNTVGKTDSGNTIKISTTATTGVVAAQDEEESAAEITTLGGLKISAPVTGQALQSKITETDAYTGSIIWSTNNAKAEGGKVYKAAITLTAKSGYHFDSGIKASIDKATTSGLKVSSESEANTVSFTLTFAETAADKSTTNSNDKTDQSKTSDSKTAANSGSASGNISGSAGGNSGSISSQSSSSGSSGSAGSTSSSAASSSDSSSEDINTEMMTAFSISANDNMVLSMNVDELDILSIKKDQKAVITLDALEGQEFEGTITRIAGSATSSGGVSKYAVEVTIPKDESMLVGMNASATITIEEKENVVLIPADALQERGNRVFVYTKKGDDDALTGEVEVETGLSNGSKVEITSGLSAGDAVYYNVISASSDSASGENTMMMPGGGMMNSTDGGDRQRPDDSTGGPPDMGSNSGSGSGKPSN